MDQQFDKVIFGTKTFGDILQEIHSNSNRLRNDIDILITDLRLLVTDSAEALVVVPLIKDYLSVHVNNDNQLVKMAAIVQRALARSASATTDDSGTIFLNDYEWQQIQELAKEQENLVFKKKNELEASRNKQLPLPAATNEPSKNRTNRSNTIEPE